MALERESKNFTPDLIDALSANVSQANGGTHKNDLSKQCDSPFAGRITHASYLTGNSSEKRVLHIEMLPFPPEVAREQNTLKPWPLCYLPGDVLSIIPENNVVCLHHSSPPFFFCFIFLYLFGLFIQVFHFFSFVFLFLLFLNVFIPNLCFIYSFIWLHFTRVI